MPIDSTAALLFRMGADTGDAEANIERFRSLLGKDLGDMSSEFSAWSTKVFGNLSTVSGAMTALGAATGAVVVAAVGAIEKLANKHAEYVAEVQRGSIATGISTEHMSGLKLMAEETGTSYDSLVTGLTRFASTIVKAATGSQQQMQAFHLLGISQEQVKAGEKDMMPLLELVADRYQHLGSQVDKTAIARELFSRGGAALVRMLSLGAQGIKDFDREAARLGLTVTTQDVVAMEQYNETIKATTALNEAMADQLGKKLLPLSEYFKMGILGVAIAFKDLKHLLKGDFWEVYNEDVFEAAASINTLSHALANLPKGGNPLGDPDDAKQAKEDYRGISDVLDEIMSKQSDLAGPVAKAADEAQKLRDKLEEARDKLRELHEQGKISEADFQAQMQDSRIAAVLLPDVIAGMAKKAGDAVLAAVKETGTQLQQELLKQGPQTLAVKLAEWDAETAARRAKIVQQGKEQGADETANLALLDQVYAAGVKKLWDDAGAAEIKSNEEIQAKIAAQTAQTFYAKRAAWDREVDEMAATFAKEGTLTDEKQKELAALRKAGLDKIDAEQKAAYDTEMARLGEQLARIEREHMTSAQRIQAEYEADAAKYSAAEQKKTLALTASVYQRAAILAQFAAIQKGLLDKEQADLQQLANSQGWQGVFGAKFAEMIRGNEALSKEWATAQNQSLLMVKVALESMKEMSQQAFQEMAQGMGGAIAHSLVYSQSIGKAMEAALKATLESLSAQALVHSIYSLALGFLDLAEGNVPGATAAFEAAALFAAVGVAAGIAGRAIPSGGAAGAGGAASANGGASTGGAGGSGQDQSGRYGTAAGAPAGGPHVTVNVYGHVFGTSGVQQLASTLNDAVLNQGVTLTATNTTTGRQVQQ